jgi:hypothetical protein
MPTKQQLADTARRLEQGLAYCSRCKEEKPVSEFTPVKGRTYGTRHQCKPCYAYLERHRKRKTNLGRYGLTRAEYDALVAKHDGLCDICRKPETKVSKYGSPHDLSIDHCHKTGKIRGFLCQVCNKGLGLFYDDPERLEKAAEYLRRSVANDNSES